MSGSPRRPLLHRLRRTILTILLAALCVARLGAQSAAGLPAAVERPGSYDAWIARVDDGGQVAWTARFGGTGADAIRALAATGDGMVALGQVERPASRMDGWAVALDPSGVTRWEAVFDRGGTEVLVALAVLPGRYLLGGFRSVASGETVAWLLAVDDAGAVVAERSLAAGGYDTVTTLAAASDGALVAGFRGEPGGDSHGWIAHVDADLHVTARQRLPGRVMPTGIAVRTDGVFAGGSDHGRGWLAFRGEAGKWRELTPSLPCGSSGFNAVAASDDGGVAAVGWCGGYDRDTDALVVWLDPELSPRWFRTYGGPEHDEASAVVSLLDGHLVLGGATKSPGAGKHDMWLVRLDAAGEPVWERRLGDAGDDRATAVLPLAGDLIVAGYRKVWR